MDMNKRLAPVVVAVGMLGIVGGVAATQAFQPVKDEAPRKVELVQPAAVTATSSPEVTVTATPTPTPAPKPQTVTPKPVQSVKAKAPAAPQVQTQQRQAVVSEQPADPAPAKPLLPVKPPGPGKTLDPNVHPSGG